VPVEPEKKKWDISWSYTGYVANFGEEVPYTFQDIVMQNRNVGVAKVLTSAKSFDAFAEADIAGLNFSTAQSTIGSDWRRTTPAPAATWDDRYYIIRDGDDNYYKLRFTSLTENNTRGLPAIEYVLVRRG
jgi:hypothetical protein